MSYCRFSSMNWMCDVYVYADCYGGFITHVATNRRIFQPIPDIGLRNFTRFAGTWNKETREIEYSSKSHKFVAGILFSFLALWHRMHMRCLDFIPSKNIGLPHDGESFNDETALECADRLEYLKSLGYKVPDYAIEALRGEE